jgi:hypothetical protein
MKTTKKRIQKKSRPNKTRKRNVKRKSRKATKTHKRKYMNKRYDGGREDGGNEFGFEETEFGFDDPDIQFGIDEISGESKENIKTIFNNLVDVINSKHHFIKYNDILDRQYYSKLLYPEIYKKNKIALTEMNEKYNKFVKSVKESNSFIPFSESKVEIKTLKDWSMAIEQLFAFTGQYDKYVYDSRISGEPEKQAILDELGNHCNDKNTSNPCEYPEPCSNVKGFKGCKKN